MKNKVRLGRLYLLLLLLTSLFSFDLLAQTVSVKGTITLESDKQPVIGANVVVKGATNGTVTDFDGNFSLNVPQNSLLEISYIGCKTQQIKVTSSKPLFIVLQDDTQALEEVIVVGYGSQKKVNLTGAVSQVDSKVLESRPITNVSSALQGTIPNLTITPSSGKPGESANINIRGTTSLNGGSPLILVDGVEMSLDLVNPSDIANVTVLKDAAASAIYGVRAAYGVVLVTTKTAGSDSRTVVSYSGNVAFSNPTVLPDMVNTSYEHAEFINRAMVNAGLSVQYPLADIEKMKAYANDPSGNPEFEVINGALKYYGYSDWTNLMLRNATPSHRHNINVSGGNEKTKFFASVGFVNQEGMYKINPDDFKRINTRLSVDNQTTDWLKLGVKFLYNTTSEDEPYKYKDNVWQQMVFSSPTRMSFPWQGDARYPEYDKYKGLYFDDQNPISLMEHGGRTTKKQHDIWLTTSADMQFMPGWKARVDFTYNMNYDKDSEHRKRVDMITGKFVPTEGNTNNNSIKQINNNKNYYSFNAYTEYERDFAKKHYLKAM